MSKQRNYTEGAVVYLPNEKSREIYLIKSGKARVSYIDIETGEEVNKILKSNDFFGLISALGNFQRDETVTAITNLSVIIFVPDEFQSLASKNLNLIRKFLQHFSHQLREIGTKVNQILSQRIDVDPAHELFKIGEYYQKNKKFEQAIYAYTRYTEHYPNGDLTETAKKRIQECRKGVHRNITKPDIDLKDSKSQEESISEFKNEIEMEENDKKEIAKKYYEAHSLFSNKNYKEALKLYESIEKSPDFEKYDDIKQKVIPDMGICYLKLEDYSKSIRILTDFIRNNPGTEMMKTILFNIGKGYEGLEKNEKAKGFYKKVISMKPENEPINYKAKKRLDDLS
jgi:CRP-like cAMP-binding protein